METKHTPGPWTEDGFKVTAKDKTICRVDLEGGANAFDNANAKLIAAAPELLEALVHAKKRIVLLELYTDGMVDPSNMELIDGAIKKATK